MAAQQPQQVVPIQIEVTFVDRPELGEIYADCVHSINIDGQTCRIVFGVNRPNDPVVGKPPSVKQFPCARIVLPLGAGLDLAEKLRQVVDLMERQGAIVRTPTPPMPPSTPFGTSKPN